MHPILKTILAILVGFVVGSIVNMGIIMISDSVIPLPEGVNPNDMESLKANMHTFAPIHFLMPFLAHALGTFVGAFLAAKIAFHKLFAGIFIGAFFLIGGIANSFMLPAPTWFVVVDVVFAYLPVAFLATKFAPKKEPAFDAQNLDQNV